MLYPQATTFPRLSKSEESNIILQDIFEYDSDGMNTILEQLCEEEGIAFDWETNGDEIDTLIIDNEDELIAMYQGYLKVEGADETPETEEEDIQF